MRGVLLLLAARRGRGAGARRSAHGAPLWSLSGPAPGGWAGGGGLDAQAVAWEGTQISISVPFYRGVAVHLRLALPALLLLAPSAGAQGTVTATYRCSFAHAATVTDRAWATERPRIETGPTEGLDVIFDRVDVRKGTARMIGNAGAEDITVQGASGLLHFLEVTSSGNLVTTTLFLTSRRESGEVRAVMSRHMLMIGTVIVSQNYGTCRELR